MDDDYKGIEVFVGRGGRRRKRRLAIALALLSVVGIAATGKMLWGSRRVADMPVEAARQQAISCEPNTREARAAAVRLMQESERNMECLKQLAAAGDTQAQQMLVSLRERTLR